MVEFKCTKLQWPHAIFMPNVQNNHENIGC
jgi:hypothetical protein